METNGGAPQKYPRGHHPNTLAALRPSKPGECRNRKGRPPAKENLKECLIAELARRDRKTGETNEQMIATALVRKATGGDLKAIELVLAYTTRKPDQGIIPQGGILINLVSNIPRPEPAK